MPPPSMLERGFGLDLFLDQLEILSHAGVNDRVENFTLHFLAGESGIVLEGNLFSGGARSQRGGAFIDLEFFGAGERDSQPQGNVVADMIAAHGQHAAMPDDSVFVDDIIGDSAADVDDDRAKLFLMFVENRLGGGQGVDDDLIDLDPALPNAAQRILHACADAVNDVEVRLELSSHHPDGVENALLAIHVIVLNDGMQKMVFGRDVDFASLHGHLLHITIVNLVAIGSYEDGAPAVEAANMTPRRGDKHAADLGVAVGLGVRQGVVNALGCDGEIDDFAFAHAP